MAWTGFGSLIALAVLLIAAGCQSPPAEAMPAASPSAPPTSSSIDLPAVPAAISPMPTTASVPAPATTATPLPFQSGPDVIGYSALGRPLNAYRLGAGPIKRAIIGGLHGGYEANTTRLMSATLDYLREHPDMIPPEITLFIVPLANPDGYAAGADAVVGRMNGRGVDLNRNWDYQWQMTATHGTRPVFAGSAAFSEPETRALRDFILRQHMDAVIFYHSVYAAVFHGAGEAQSHTVELAQRVAQATGYTLRPEGVPGQLTTGNAIDWLSANGIAAIEVELSTRADLDWEQNLRGLRTFLSWRPPR